MVRLGVGVGVGVGLGLGLRVRAPAGEGVAARLLLELLELIGARLEDEALVVGVGDGLVARALLRIGAQRLVRVSVRVRVRVSVKVSVGVGVGLGLGLGLGLGWAPSACQRSPAALATSAKLAASPPSAAALAFISARTSWLM